MIEPIKLTGRITKFFAKMREIDNQKALSSFDPVWMEQAPVFSVDFEKIQSQKRRKNNFFYKWGSVAAAFVLFVSGIYIYRYEHVPVSPSGVAVGLLGQVELERGDAKRFLVSGDALYPGDRIITGPGASLNVLMTPGHALQITSSTSIALNHKSEKDYLSVENGQIFLHVQDEKGVVHLESRGVTMETREGSLVLDSTKERTAILVMDGELSILPGKGNPGKSMFTGPALLGMDESGGVIRWQPDLELLGWMERKDRELASLVNPEEESFLSSLESLSLSRNDADLIKKFGRKPGIIHLKDGNFIRGVVASSAGKRLLIETVGGARMLKSDDIEQFDYHASSNF